MANVDANISLVGQFYWGDIYFPIIKIDKVSSTQEWVDSRSSITYITSDDSITLFYLSLTNTNYHYLTECVESIQGIPPSTEVGVIESSSTIIDGSLFSYTLDYSKYVANEPNGRKAIASKYFAHSYKSFNQQMFGVEYTKHYNEDHSFYYDGYGAGWGNGTNCALVTFVEDGVTKYAPMTFSSSYNTLDNKSYYRSTKWSNSIFSFGAVITEQELKDLGEVQPPYKPTPDNPYPDQPPSDIGGGGGNFDDTSDPIPDSSTPTLSSANTGFTRIYNPSLAQVQALANYLWTDESVITTIWNHIKQYFEDPMQAIIGFNLVPVPVPDGGTEEFKLMYIGTGVQMTVAANQFVDVDCGTLTVEKYYGSALDYSPYTKISCFLPFIGNVDLNPDEVMDTTLQIKYRVDICSGSCVAKILVNGTVLYQYSGHCAIPIPLASSDFASYVSAAVSVAKLAIGAAVAGGAGAAAAASTEAGQATGNTVTTTIQTTARNPETGRQITTGTQTITQTKQSQDTTKASFDGLSPKNISNTVGEIMTSKPTFQHSGSFSGNTGYLGIRRPYLIITRPNLCMPASYQSMNGFPCMITLKLGDCTGFTQVQQCILSGFTATNPEQSEILQLLKSGVIL